MSLPTLIDHQSYTTPKRIEWEYRVGVNIASCDPLQKRFERNPEVNRLLHCGWPLFVRQLHEQWRVRGAGEKALISLASN